VVARVQEARLQVLMRLLKQREDQHNDLNLKRLDRLWFVVCFSGVTRVGVNRDGN